MTVGVGEALRVLLRSGPGKAGIVLLIALIAISLYVLATYPAGLRHAEVEHPRGVGGQPQGGPSGLGELAPRDEPGGPPVADRLDAVRGHSGRAAVPPAAAVRFRCVPHLRLVQPVGGRVRRPPAAGDVEPRAARRADHRAVPPRARGRAARRGRALHALRRDAAASPGQQRRGGAGERGDVPRRPVRHVRVPRRARRRRSRRRGALRHADARRDAVLRRPAGRVRVPRARRDEQPRGLCGRGEGRGRRVGVRRHGQRRAGPRPSRWGCCSVSRWRCSSGCWRRR